LLPQQRISPDDVMAQADSPPSAIAETPLVKPLTGIAVLLDPPAGDDGNEPSPSCP
jgi:hypothetical protein